MTTLDRIAAIFHRARLTGGWDDEDVALKVLAELGLDENGEPVKRGDTSSEIGRG